MRAFGEWPPGLRAVLAVAASCLFMVLVAWADAARSGRGVHRSGAGAGHDDHHGDVHSRCR